MHQFEILFLYNPLYCSTFYTQIIEEEPVLDKTQTKKITNYQVEFWLLEKSRFENAPYMGGFQKSQTFQGDDFCKMTFIKPSFFLLSMIKET